MDVQQVTTEEEFKKNPDLKASDLDELRGWLQTQPHLPEVSDKLLILFHYSKRFDLARTRIIIENFFTMRTNAPEFFTNRDITCPDLVKCAEIMDIATLPVPDPNGYIIHYIGFSDTEQNHFVHADVVKLMFMTYEASSLQHGTMAGCHTIFDMKGTKLKHLARLSLSVLKKYVLYGENALPVRREVTHMVNVTSLTDKLMMLVKPWLSKESAENIHYHTTDNIETLYKHIPKECLPKELGGYLGSVEEFHAANCRTLKGLSDYFAEEEKMRVDESKRCKKSGK